MQGTGRGAVIGVIDASCDFTDPSLRTNGGTTRLLALWDQRADVVHVDREIDRALAAHDPFRALGYAPLVDDDSDTPIAIAARGAPGAKLVFVHLAAPRRACVRDAIDLIAHVAGARPCVINLPANERTAFDDRDGRLVVRSPHLASAAARLFASAGRPLDATELRNALGSRRRARHEAARLFDAFTVPARRRPLADTELIAGAGVEPHLAVRAGDWLVERVLGEDGVAAMRLVTSETIALAETPRANRIVVRRDGTSKRFAPRGTDRLAPRGPVAMLVAKPAAARLVAKAPRALGEVIGGFLDEPPHGTVQVTRNGVFLHIGHDVKFSPTLDKTEQAIGILTRSLVGTAYTPELARDLRGQMKLVGSGTLTGLAKQAEQVGDHRGGFGVTSASTGIAIIRWLRDTRKLKVLVDDLLVQRLEHARAVELAWQQVFEQTQTMRSRGYGVSIFPHATRYWWVTQGIFTDIAWSGGLLVESARVAQLAFDLAPDSKYGAPPFDNRMTAIGNLWSRFDEGAAPLHAIWEDAALKSHKGYRLLFPTDEDADPHGARVRFIEVCLARYPALARQARESEAVTRRKDLLEKFTADFEILLQLTTSDRDGEDALRAQVSKANAAPFPCALRISPQGPLVPADGDLHAEMDVDADHWASLWKYHFWWDLLRVEPDQVTETSTSWRTMLGRRLGRDASNSWTDFQRIRSEMEDKLGLPGIGAISIGGSLAIIRFVGTVLKDVLGAIFEKPFVKRLVLPEPGIYMLRCVAGNPDSDGPLERVPSAAYQLLFVAEPAALSQLEAERALEDLRSMRAGKAELEAETKSGLLAPDELERKQRDLEIVEAELAGDIASLYALQRKNLHRARTDPTLAAQLARDPAHVESKIVERLEEIDRITGERARRLGSVTGKAYRVRATLVTDGGTMHLMIEAIDVKTTADGVTVFVLDSTAKKSGQQQETAPTRLAAIKKAMLSLLENETTGYGRGVCTILVPVGGVTSIGAHERETFPVAKDLISLFNEMVEGTALIASVLALLAAPFTGGTSLMIMIPIGIVGVIPSGYRLAKRNEEGTFAWDMETALDIVNIASAFFGAGQAASGSLKLTRLAGAFKLVGHGADGLGVIMGTVQFFEELEAIARDPNMLPGQRRLAMAMAVANKLMNDGSALGHALAMRTYGDMIHQKMDPAKHKLPAGVLPVDTSIPVQTDRSIPSHLKPASEPITAKVRDLMGGREVPVFVDPSGGVKGAGAEVRYVLDAYGFISDVYIVLGKNADHPQLPSHAATAKQLLKFTGVLGKARTLIDWARAFFARDPSLQVGKTRAWEARLELEKLPKQISDYMRSIGIDPTKTPDHVDAYIQGLLDQLAEHATALKDAERGSGRIAAHDRSEPPKRTARQAALDDGREYAMHITDIPPGSVTVKGAPSTQQHISVWRDGGKLEIRVPERAPDGSPITAAHIADAVRDHQQLADRRPRDPRTPDAARPWTALDEARYRGYPDPDAGHTWAWKDGALVLDGVPPQHYNQASGAFDGGAGSAKHPAAPPTARRKPEDAARWPEVEPYTKKPYTGTPPPGYKERKRKGKPHLRRLNPDDAIWPRLRIDDDNLIQPGAPASNRLSDPAAAARNYGPKPDAHQLHHRVPDAVVRKHPLFQEARTRGTPPYDLDHKPNLIALPEDSAARAREPGSSELPLHRGSHEVYAAVVSETASRVRAELQLAFPDGIPPDVLAQATKAVEGATESILRAWTKTQGDKLR